MKIIKVLYIAHSSELHGAGFALLNILKAFKHRPVESIVVLPQKGDLCKELNKIGIAYKFVPLAMSIYPNLKSIRDYVLFFPRLFRMLFYNLLSYIQLGEIIKKEVPHIIHTNAGVIHISHFIANRYKIPHVWHIREFQDLHFGWIPFPTNRFFLNLLQNNNNYVIAITNIVLNHHHLKKKNSCVIYDGVFDTNVVPIIVEKENYFLFVGSLEKAKGIENVINAFIQIAHEFPLYKLLIAGVGTKIYTTYLENIVINSGLEERIVFLGFRKDIYNLMSKAMGLIVYSKFEGFGFITAEAMYNGCLVIGFNTAGTKEQFDNGIIYTGQEIGLRYSTQEELVIQLKKVCNCGIEPFLPILIKAQKTVIPLYSIEKSALSMFNIYKSILSR